MADPSTPAPPAPDDLACLDGRIGSARDAVVPATDEGLLRGDGVFEVIRVYAGRPFALLDHLERLGRSARGLRLDPPPREVLEREARELVAAQGGQDFGGCLRVVLTRGGRRLLLTEPLPSTPERARLAFVTFAPSRVLDGLKTLSYAGNMLATRVANERGFDDALLVTPHGRVLEAPTSSLFWAGEDGGLCTPPLDEHILASITRDRLLRCVEVEERPVGAEELLTCREAFLASTTREVQSVAAIEGRSFPEAGERTREAAAALRALIESELGPA